MKFKLFPAQALLQQKAVALQVSQLAKTLSGRGPHYRGTICPSADGYFQAGVSEKRLLAQADACCSYYAVVFRFAAAEGQAGLCRWPKLGYMRAKAHPRRC